MFEKYDGIRGFWNPLKKAFYSRYGKTFAIPDRILDVMPKDSFLEGEIWYSCPFPSPSTCRLHFSLSHPLPCPFLKVRIG